MQRKKEFEKVKEVIKENFCFADCGIYNTRNVMGDYMTNIFNGEYFTIDLCFGYSYFEVFGTNADEFKKLLNFYEDLRLQKTGE